MTGRTEKSVGNQSKKREAKEREKRIEKANAMLIPAPKTTTEKMGLISFDADGIFRLTKNRFVKMYVFDDERQETKNHKEESEEKMRTEAEIYEKAKNKLLEILREPLDSKIRITKQLSDGVLRGRCNRDFITLTAGADTADEARSIFKKDEEAIGKHIRITPMSADDVLGHILDKDADDTSYASLVRAKKDWYREMPEIAEDTANFRLKDMFGESLFVLQYPDIVYDNPLERLRELGCPMMVAVDLERITPEDQIDFIRSMEKRYNRRIPDAADSDFLNTSLELMFLCDSEDARRIIEKTILTMYAKEGFIMVPAIGSQKNATMSMMSLGLMNENHMRNVSEDVVRKILM